MKQKYKLIHIFGAAGSGVSTLGRALADATGYRFVDNDDIYWLPDEPLFSVKRPIPERQALLRDAVAQARDGLVLAGSMMDWGDPVLYAIDLAVFLYTPAEVRHQRLQRREAESFGDAILPGGERHIEYLEFLQYAMGYDSGGLNMRSLTKHRAWMNRLTCPVLELDGVQPVDTLVQKVLAYG